MVDFKPATEWNKPGGGRKPIAVPPQLAESLRKTYETGTFFEVGVDPQNPSRTDEVIHLAQLVCRRADKSLQHEVDHARFILKLRMRDKRSYTKSAARNEER